MAWGLVAGRQAGGFVIWGQQLLPCCWSVCVLLNADYWCAAGAPSKPGLVSYDCHPLPHPILGCTPAGSSMYVQPAATDATTPALPSSPHLPGQPYLSEEEQPELLVMRRQLLAHVEQLQLPPNFLDALIGQLGGPGAVAEMTGRKGRVVKDARGRMVYELRAKPDSNEMDSLNGGGWAGVEDGLVPGLLLL